MKYTPGPWTIHHAYREIKPFAVLPGGDSDPWVSCSTRISNGEKLICEVSMSTCKGKGCSSVSNVDEMVANAYLIKEAPRLLEALEDCVKHIEEDAWPEWIDELKTIIAKAKGEFELIKVVH
jgi:hypothetical protein